jgi:GNAT superfamily N-acetyltransferase
MDVTIRLLREDDLGPADRIMRLAFGTFLGLPDPLTFMGDASYVRTRWRVDPGAAFAAELDGEIIGSNFATNWGSIGFFGPLTVRPDFWDKGIASRLLAPVMECFQRWGTKHAGLFTFAQSTKHVHLYQKFGFWPRFLTAVMIKRVQAPAAAPRWSTFSAIAAEDRDGCLAACRRVTEDAYGGLDLTREITAIETHGLGDTVLLRDGSDVIGMAPCYSGPGTEAGSGVCFVKFGAVRPAGDGKAFAELLDACDAFAAKKGARHLIAAVNTGRALAYQAMLTRGFRTQIQGVVMQRPNEPAYNRPDVYLIDDWR